MGLETADHVGEVVLHGPNVNASVIEPPFETGDEKMNEKADESLGIESSIKRLNDGSIELTHSTSHPDNNPLPTKRLSQTPTPEDIEQGKDPSSQDDTKQYSMFSPLAKKLIVLAATMGAFYSPFTAQIYFPALTSIAMDLGVSDTQVNLTMTTYMILQAIAPAFIGGFSDTAGRRPAYIVCFVIYIAADVALALQNNYVALLVLRMLQSAGSSGTVSIANATIADIATSSERGLYIGITSLATILAPSLGPILGGIISQYAGWHWIFWFLALLAVVFFIPMLLFLPETCRLVVGDGSVPPPLPNRTLFSFFRPKAYTTEQVDEGDELSEKRGPIRFPNPLATLKIAAEKECFLILVYASLIYAGFYAVISGMPSQLSTIYHFDNLKVGLMYLPMSGGSIVAAFVQGKVVDWVYAREARKLGIAVTKSRQQDLTHFPIEKARLKVATPMIVLATLSTIVYGWLLHFRTSIAGPCIVLFVMGFSMIGATQCVSILIVDINPGQAGTATAAFNLVRCLLGAAATALIVPMTDAMGLGWSYTLIGLVWVLTAPMLGVVVKWGPGWRRERKETEERRGREANEAKEREMKTRVEI